MVGHRGKRSRRKETMTDFTDTEIDFTEGLDFTDDPYYDDVAIAMMGDDDAAEYDDDRGDDVAAAWGF